MTDDLLDEIQEFLQGQEDTRDGIGGPRPNKAMSLLSRLRFARKGTQVCRGDWRDCPASQCQSRMKCVFGKTENPKEGPRGDDAVVEQQATASEGRNGDVSILADVGHDAPDSASNHRKRDKISPISDDIGWSAKAAAADAMERAGHVDAILCVWVDEKGQLKYSKANTSLTFASIVAVWAMDWATRFWETR